jgi:hypothetical protein
MGLQSTRDGFCAPPDQPRWSRVLQLVQPWRGLVAPSVILAALRRSAFGSFSALIFQEVPGLLARILRSHQIAALDNDAARLSGRKPTLDGLQLERNHCLRQSGIASVNLR